MSAPWPLSAQRLAEIRGHIARKDAPWTEQQMMIEVLLPAFAALLAVAKEADANDTTNYLLRDQLVALNTAHPSWRDWTP